MNTTLLSPRLVLVIKATAVLFLSMLAARIGFWLWFYDANNYASDVTLKALFIGARFDLRLAVLGALFLLLATLFRSLLVRRIIKVLMVCFILLASLLYISDFAHFSYLEERINVSVLRFAEDGLVSAQMVWESYAFVRLVLVWLFITWLLAKILFYFLDQVESKLWFGYSSLLKRSVAVVGSTLLVLLALMGKWNSLTPLRWSDAYFANDPKVAALGLNPVIFFWDTLFSQTRPYDEKLVEKLYPQVSRYLGVDARQVSAQDRQKLDFSRVYPAAEQWKGKRKPNLVFIHLESMGTNRLGIMGNQMGATPNLDHLAENGWFFPKFFVPSSGTARTVFGLLTGIPDVSWGGTTASRNPLIVDQYTLVNALEGYEKLFFIGGAAGWANIKGLLEHNVDGLELWEEGDYQSPRIDVWGISDRALFQESHARLNEIPEDRPFVAFIQTAGNHRPFTIPEDDSSFEKRLEDEERLKEYGFLGNDQFNAVRLLDFNIGYYLNELVAGSHYQDNTIFVLYGDHNDRSWPAEHTGYSDKLFLTLHHVPCIIYAPGLIDHQSIDINTSLVDVLPTTLALAGIPFENRTMGRNLLKWNKVSGKDGGKESFAFTFGGDRQNNPLIGLLGEDYYLTMYHDGTNPMLFDLSDPGLDKDYADKYPEVVEEMKPLLEGWYQTARYMLHHNKNNDARREN